MITCTNKPCPLRYMCELANDTQTGEFFEYKTLKGHDNQGNIRYTHGCDHFEKKTVNELREDLRLLNAEIELKQAHLLANEVYGKIEPTELENDVD